VIHDRRTIQRAPRRVDVRDVGFDGVDSHRQPGGSTPGHDPNRESPAHEFVDHGSPDCSGTDDDV
jgi:hypothetical protein